MAEWWEYDQLESGAPYDWSPAERGDHPDDQIDFHLDLGAGTLRKARLTVDSRGEPDILMNLDTMVLARFGEETSTHSIRRKFFVQELPFPDNSIHSIISHHCLEHIGYGFIHLMDECYRVLQSGGKFRIIVPMFPSFSAVDDVDHVRYFTKESFNCFVHDAPLDVPFWSEAFSSPYTKSRFRLEALDYTQPEEFDLSSGTITIDRLFEKGREIRATLKKP